MCLESFEKGEVASATGGVEVVADKSNTPCPMQFPLGINSHDHLSCPTWIVSNGAPNKRGHEPVTPILSQIALCYTTLVVGATSKAVFRDQKFVWES